MHPRIRRLAADEWEAYRDVRLASLRDSPEAFATSYEDAVRLGEAEWRERAAIPAWLAYLGDEPVGIVRVAVLDGGLPHLLSMWVAPGARGSRAAEELVHAALGWARGEGLPGVALRVVTSNARAQAFYRRCGFEASGATYTLPDGRPEIEMEHPFAPP